MTKLTKAEYEKLYKWVERIYDLELSDYHNTPENFKRNIVRHLATFLFDNGDQRTALKRWLPQDIYIRVLEALADGDHDT